MAIPAFPLEASILEPPRMDASTRGCATFGHPELVVEYDADRTARADVERLLSSLHEAVRSGARFAQGDHVRIGTFALRVEGAGPRALALVEPDLAGPPGTFRRGVDTTLAHLRAQQEMAESLGLDTVFPSLADRARVCAHLRAQTLGAARRQLVLDRSAPRHHGDSGIVVGCGAELDAAAEASSALDAHALDDVSVRELVVGWPMLIPFVGLPSRTTVVCVGPDEALVLRDDREVVVRLLEAAPRSMRVARAPLARCLR